MDTATSLGGGEHGGGCLPRICSASSCFSGVEYSHGFTELPPCSPCSDFLLISPWLFIENVHASRKLKVVGEQCN